METKAITNGQASLGNDSLRRTALIRHQAFPDCLHRDVLHNTRMEPWNDEPFTIWKTQPAFFSWLRGQLRRSWSHYPIAKKFKDSKCRPNRAGGRAKFVGDCSQCGATMAKSRLQIDHIIPAGSIVSWETAGLFLKSLFTTSNNMRLVCKPCHHTITQMERYSLTIEEAAIRAKVIAFTKTKPGEQIHALDILGCPSEYQKNAALRREAYQHLLSSGAFEGLSDRSQGACEASGQDVGSGRKVRARKVASTQLD